jgi:tocopherol O-methyltransferase
MREQAGRIRRYYDQNTFWMLLFGRGRGEAAIHRPVWSKRDLSRAEALHTVERLIADALLADGGSSPMAKRFLDLGCGVGGSALWLAAHHPVCITGVTLSPVQAQTARRLALRRGLDDRCTFLVGDFTTLPELPIITDAYAVESFSHGDDPESFFTQIAKLLPRGGRLALCDDFLTAGGHPDMTHPDAIQRQRWLSRFREGWHLQSLLTGEDTLLLAARCGFDPVERMDLTPYLHPTPALFRGLQGLAGRALRSSAWGASWYGGSALQVCLRNGWTEYLFLVLEKR